MLGILMVSCKKEIIDEQEAVSKQSADLNARRNHRNFTMAVVSDIHYMHPSLLGVNGADGLAFQNYLSQDPKMVQYSDPVFREVFTEIKYVRPDILLVPGDLTKDGEKIGHQAMAAFFDKLEKHGTEVYIIPGNHDINNTKAKKYVGDYDYPVAMTTKSDFENIYANFGLKDAISRDPNSLSYVAQLNCNLRLLAIDASKYEEYGPNGDVASGRIKPATMSWILEQLAAARASNNTVIAMMHQNLIEHYAGQTQLDPGYVIDDWQYVANTLINAGLTVIFTGHYHANDIASYSNNGHSIVDIETGSLVNAPSPYRLITVTDNLLKISSKHVETIKACLPGGLNFVAYSKLFLSTHLDSYFNYYLSTVLSVPAPLAEFAAPIFRRAYMAHLAGDESMPADQQALIEQLAAMAPPLAAMATTLWTDTGLKDNNNQIVF